MQIAGRLRLEREARGWSQGELAQRAGISKAMVSKVERGEASPTAALLGKLSGALELTLATLLARAEAGGARRTPATEQAIWRDPATGYLRRQVHARPDHPVELVEVELPSGARVDLPAASYAFIRQVVWVLEGALRIREGSQETALSTGDAYAFGEPANSAFINESPTACRYLVAVSRR